MFGQEILYMKHNDANPMTFCIHVHYTACSTAEYHVPVVIVKCDEVSCNVRIESPQTVAAQFQTLDELTICKRKIICETLISMSHRILIIIDAHVVR